MQLRPERENAEFTGHAKLQGSLHRLHGAERVLYGSMICPRSRPPHLAMTPQINCRHEPVTSTHVPLQVSQLPACWSPSRTSTLTWGCTKCSNTVSNSMSASLAMENAAAALQAEWDGLNIKQCYMPALPQEQLSPSSLSGTHFAQLRELTDFQSCK